MFYVFGRRTLPSGGAADLEGTSGTQKEILRREDYETGHLHRWENPEARQALLK